MSAFDLLDDEELINLHNFKKNKQTKNKKKSTPIAKLKPQETEFTKIHLTEVWHVILQYLDLKSLYTSILLVDKKVYEIVNTIEFQRFILSRDFADIFSGENETDHAALYKNMRFQGSLERILESNDPTNIFKFRTAINNNNNRKKKKKATDELLPSIVDSQQVFENLYIDLLNKRTKFINRNMKLRTLIRGKAYIGTRSEIEFDAYKRGKMKLFKAAGEKGFGILDNETISEIQKEERKQIECEHFNVMIIKNENVKTPYTLICKTCKAADDHSRETITKLIQKYL